MKVESVGICVKPGETGLAKLVGELGTWLRERGLEVLADPETGPALGVEGRPRRELAGSVDLLVVLGGDGTLLAVARAVGAADVPILGVNLGTLGYLAETAREDLFPTLEALLAGRLEIEERMRFAVTVERGPETLGEYIALNDAVISNTALSRMVHLETRADGAPLTTYHADGLILSTPTGSTAYSLSAGGPIVLPTLEGILVTPICAHTLTQRPLLLPASCELEVHVSDARGGRVQLTVDGQVGVDLEAGDAVTVRRSSHPARLCVTPGRNRFAGLRAKLRWGAR